MSTAEDPREDSLAQLSDTRLKDAASEGLSMHGRQSAAFDSGYLAVLHMCGTSAQHKFGHRDIAALRDVVQLDESDIDLASRFLTYCYEDPKLMPNLDELLSWANKMRGLADERVRLRAMVGDGSSSRPAIPDTEAD